MEESVMATPTTQAIATLLSDVIRRLAVDHAARTTRKYDATTTCPSCNLIARAAPRYRVDG